MKSWIDVIRSRRLLAVVLLGFSSGMPLALTAGTLQAWMTDEKIDLKTIGIFAAVGFPYTLKFLWAPLMDRFVPPFLGRRRGWMLIAQVLLVLSLSAMALVHPAKSPWLTALLALLVCFFSATQDIAVDAYRADVLENEELGMGAGLHITGYRIAMIVSSSVALIMADHMSWRLVYFAMAAIMGVGVITSFMAPEPTRAVQPPRTIRDSVVLPWVEFLKRTGAIEILGFIFVYKIGVVLSVALTTPFMLDLGFSKTDIGAVTKSVGLIATIVGSLAGGAAMFRLGMLRSLWVFGILQGFSTLAFMMLAHVGHSYPAMVTAIGAENFFSGMGNAAYFAFMMSICDKRFTATQFALFSSFMGLSRVVGGMPAGFMVNAMGWQNFFVVCTLMMIPGLIFLTRFNRWAQPEAA